MLKRFVPFLLVIILAVFLLFASKNIGNFFYPGHEGWLGAQTGIGALNFIQHGFLKMKFCISLSSLKPQAPSAPAEFYSGHPMLNYYMVALVWKIFGVSELAARLYMLLYAVGAAIFLFLLVRDLTRSNLAALFSTAFYLTFPTVQFYSHQINGEMSLLFFASGSLWFFYKYLNQTDTGQKIKFANITAIMIFLGCMMDWFSYLFAAAFAAIALFRSIRDKKEYRVFFTFVLAPISALLLYLLPVIAAQGSLSEITGKFFVRAGSEHGPYPLIPFLQINLNRIDKHFGPLFYCLFILSLLYLLYLPLKILVFKKKDWGDLFYLILLILPLTFFLLMKQLVDIHDFFMIYFSFFLAFAPVWILSNFFPLFNLIPRSALFSKEIAVKIILLVAFAPILILAAANDLKRPFASEGNIDYVYIGKYLQQVTSLNDKILMRIDYPGPNHRDFYSSRNTNEDFDPDFNKIEEIIVRDKAYKLVVLENRSDNYNAIIPLINKYKTTFYHNAFIFDITRPAGKLEVIKSVPQPTNLFWNYFVSEQRPPEKEEHIYDPKLEQALYVMLGIKPVPVNKLFPQGLSGAYYDKPDFSGNTKPFVGRNDRVYYIWTDKIETDQIGDLRYILRPWGGFSLILRGKLYIPTSGEYYFSLFSDDNASFYINDKLVLESGYRRPSNARQLLKKGWYDGRINFVDYGGEAILSFSLDCLTAPSK
jgi:hypothetical protein